MGICWSYPPKNPTPTGTVTPAGISHSQTTSGSYGISSTTTASTTTTTFNSASITTSSSGTSRRLYHPNLVKLLGYCYEETELLLVYEYMQKGSLEHHLFGRGAAVQPLPWDLRLKIAIGAAAGLSFLHTSDREIIYRDFKASNILLDGSYNAKISDFGLAKLGPSASQSHLSTTVMGTPGYAAPEYMQTGHLYVKSDVYGFGVVLVEILTGLRAIDLNRPTGYHSLTDWIKPHLHDKRKLRRVMDHHLGDKYPIKAAFPIAKLASRCLAPEPKMRPSMKDVLEDLQGIQASTNKTVEVRGDH
ncbi:hypothetical protein TSUD_254630 [Trifolium subterraneum]|uniref:Protein kinase domain-containing protein n=1 Tax=Trifolium subterraneum TaxID=3900 RepID=A0A2Z6P2N0_TRISU|nr:hypothetical protein TSUD_254630 [Trifolium subterraneum]